MPSAAYSFEAKLHAFRRTQDGVVVSYVVHPSDVNADLAVAALGTRYMIAAAQMGDDEKPLVAQPQNPPDKYAWAAKEARAWADLPFVTQAGIRCNEPEFHKYLLVADADEAAKLVQRRCGVDTRSKIIRGTPSGDAWRDIEAGYQASITSSRYEDALR
jgi:hypothetical protein